MKDTQYERIIDKAQDLIEFERLKRDLVVRLKLYEDLQKFQLEQLQKIKGVAKRLAQIKGKNGFKINQNETDIRKCLFKYGQGY